MSITIRLKKMCIRDRFYEEAYHFIEEKFGADNVISAVMHADEDVYKRQE